MDEYEVPQNAGRVGAGRAGLASASYRPHRSAGMDAGTRRLAFIAGGLGGCLLLVVGVWSLTGHGSGAVPVIQADKTPLRVKPENAGGMQVAGGTDDLMTADATGKAGTVAPPPETPDPQALRAQVAQGPAVGPAVGPAAPSPSAAETTAPPVPPPAKAAAAAPVARVPAPRVMARATPVAAGSVLGTPRHGAEVQLGALSTEAGARVEWERLAHRLPGLFDQHRPDVARAEVNGRTFWRLRTSGFSDVAEATTFCEQVRGKGGDCSIVAF